MKTEFTQYAASIKCFTFHYSLNIVQSHTCRYINNVYYFKYIGWIIWNYFMYNIFSISGKCWPKKFGAPGNCLLTSSPLKLRERFLKTRSIADCFGNFAIFVTLFTIIYKIENFIYLCRFRKHTNFYGTVSGLIPEDQPHIN